MARYFRYGIITLAALCGACTVSETPAPPLQGPSELALSLAVFANPDVLSQDGASQSQIAVQAFDANGQPARDIAFRAEITVGGVSTDFGSLSARTLVTGNDGRATVIYTAPAAPLVSVDTNTRVTIRLTPSGGNSADAQSRYVEIRLVPPGIITGGNAPTAAFTVNPASPAAFTPATFDGSTSTPAPGGLLVLYSWNFGDGSTASGRTAIHQFAAGSYLVTLTVTDNNGITGSISKTVTVGTGSLPTADFVFSPAAPVLNQDIFFNASISRPGTGRTIVRYDWDFGSGAPRSGITVSKSYDEAGGYTVVLTITDDVGQTATGTQTVSVAAAPGGGGSGPTAEFTFSPTGPGVSQTVFFDGSGSTTPSGTTITSHAWNFGDGGTASGIAPTHAFTAAGTYVVRLTVTNSSGQTGSVTKNVAVTAAAGGGPTPQFTFSPQSPGVGEAVFFNASTSTAGAGHTIASYAWTFGDGATGTGVTPTHVYGTAGSYGVQLTVTDEIGQATTSASTSISVGNPPAPTANFTFSPASPGRFDEVVFDASSSTTAQGQTIVDVAWNFGDGTAVVHCGTLFGNDPSCVNPGVTNRISAHTFATAQTFVVNLVVTDSAGRMGSRNTTVTVALAQPTVVITTSPGSPNPGTVVNFNSNGTTYYPGSGPASFAWTFGDGGTSALANPTHPYLAVGTYGVGLSVTDDKGRTGTGTATVTVVAVTPPAPPVAAFTFSPPTPSLAAGGVVSFDGSTSSTPSGAAINLYRWNFGDGTIISGAPAGPAPAPGGTFQAPQHTYLATGSFTVTLTVTDTNGLSGSTPGTVTIGP